MVVRDFQTAHEGQPTKTRRRSSIYNRQRKLGSGGQARDNFEAPLAKLVQSTCSQHAPF